MSAPVFVDTNIFIYSIDRADPAKLQAARRWREQLWKSRRGRVSFQVLHEFYAKATYKWPAARDQVRSEVRDLLAWQPVVLDAAVLELAWKMQDRYRLSFWDGLIAGAAKAAGCRYLLTEDLQDKQDLDELLIVNPFNATLETLPQ